MFLILGEFEWFIMFRHQFVAKQKARNYSVYVQNIPEEYRTDRRLLEFFQQASPQGSVLHAHICMKSANLKKKVAIREKLVASLEHAINIEEIKGITPMKRSLVGEDVNAIDALFEELQDLNREISEAIADIDLKSKHDPEYEKEEDATTDVPETAPLKDGRDYYANKNHADDASRSGIVSTLSVDQSQILGNGPSPGNEEDSTGSGMLNSARNLFGKSASQLSTGLAGGLKGATTLLKSEDGERYSAGFVQFRSLRATQAALQMLQYPTPFKMEVLEAPQAEGRLDR